MESRAEKVALLKAYRQELRAAGRVYERSLPREVRYVTKAAPAYGGPHIRKGESILSSRGFMFSRLLGVAAGRISPDEAKIELDLHRRMTKCLNDHNVYATQGSLVAPLGAELLPSGLFSTALMNEARQLVKSGTAGADPDEMGFIRKAVGGGMDYINATQGGSLVAPPVQGELIDLLRNEDMFLRAGSRIMPFPPNGRITMPRITSPTTGSWLGQNMDATKSVLGTGSFTLTAKKAMALVVVPNEMLRFSSVSAEAIIRDDMAKTLTLTLDKALADGPGGDLVPLGLLTQAATADSGVGVVTPTTTGANGDTLHPQDVYKFPAKVMENNAKFGAYIMRPEMFFRLVEARTGVYNGSTTVQQGPFAFDMMRDPAAAYAPILAGYPVVLSNNMPKDRVKGTGNNLTAIIGGNFAEDFVIAMFGTIEFLTTDQGIQLFGADQTAVRAILTCDGGTRRPGAFAVADTLLATVGA